MPRTIASPTSTSKSGTPVSFTTFDSTNGMALENPGSLCFVLNNLHGTVDAHVVIHVTKLIDDDLRVADRAAVVPAGQIVIFGTFPPDIYNQADGTILVDCDQAVPFAMFFIR